jgi:hypothetical protein
MKLISLDIPPEPSEWPAWLEQQLVGPDLGDLVLQLQELAGASAEPSPSLLEICGPNLNDVLASGLSVLTEEQIPRLMRFPRALLDLQERIFEEGKSHWFNLPVSAEQRTAVEDQWRSISAKAGLAADAGGSVQPAAAPARKRHYWRSIAAIAAIVLVGAAWWTLRPRTRSWGFDRPGLLAASASASEYLNSLADAADDWFQVRPESSQELAARLQEFVHGCDTLIAAPHPQLPAGDRAWLVERCQAWRSRLETELAELNAGTKPVEAVRDETDAVIRKLMNALRQRARSLA